MSGRILTDCLAKDCARILVSLYSRIEQEAPGLLRRCPLDVYIAQFDITAATDGYHLIPSGVQLTAKAIVRDFGAPTLDLYHRCILGVLVSQCEARAEKLRLPHSVTSLMTTEFARILVGLDQSEQGVFSFENELFVKDLALCRLKFLPCGSEVLEVSSGVPRRTLFRGGWSQFFEAGWFATTRLGGFSPLYESHWDRRLARLFNEKDYDQSYLRFADLLELNPSVLGVFGASWWLDPQVALIAPELAFLRRLPEQHGARVFRVGPDAAAIRDAITFSRKRRQLYEAGEYSPQRYMLVWSRRDILRWAKEFRLKSS